MLFAPVILFFFATNLIANGFIGKTLPKNMFSFELALKVNPKIDKVLDKMISESKLNPKLLEDKKSIQRLERQIPPIPRCDRGVIVKKGSSILYVSDRFNRPEILRKLPRFGYLDDVSEIEVNERVYSIEQFFFYYPDGSTGSFFLIVDVKPLYKVFFNMAFFFLLSLLVILIVVNGSLTFLVSRSIIKPLRVLQSASEQIKEGNLNCQVKASTKDEIGELANTFESMRIKLKESIDKQVQYENNRKELLTSISHDLKTPITCIKGYVEGMLDGIADTPEKMNLYMRTIRSKAIELDHLIGDLFLFSKLDLMKQPFNFESIDIYAYLKDYVEEMQFGMDEKGVGLIFHTNCLPPVNVNADRVQLNRVIGNIIQNASKYMDENRENPEIRIELIDEADAVTIGIKDNGQGIRHEDLPYIFDRFYRADPARNSTTGGSGLGLAIAKLIIENHSGSIWAESQYEVGTSIFFTLKRTKEA